jgi:carbamoyl-phosphate synthase large subunit
VTEAHSTLGVMIAGIGGASLGTELMKCLALAGEYLIFGCDISPTAFGHYDPRFEETFRIDREDYIRSVIAACKIAGVQWLVPGGEQPMILLAAAKSSLDGAGINLVANDPEIVRLYSDKSETFARLSALGIPVPRTQVVCADDDIIAVGLPCIVKPATGSGGSAMVFFAADLDEARIYSDHIRRTGAVPLAQEYISPDDGEFTVGVLSLPDGTVATSIALRRSLESKLSVLSQGRGGLISSGYTQGYIGQFPDICRQAEHIAFAIGSRGPINIQGRLRDGVLVPFEINPRLSASSYLRAMAGHNELHWLMQFSAHGKPIIPGPLREGWYLRSLTETFVPPEGLKA